jgi:hypothetical protein
LVRVSVTIQTFTPPTPTKKLFHHLTINLRLGIGRDICLGFELKAAACAGPQIEDKSPLAKIFHPFRSDQRIAAFSAGHFEIRVTDGRCSHGRLLGFIVACRFESGEISELLQSSFFLRALR